VPGGSRFQAAGSASKNAGPAGEICFKLHEKNKKIEYVSCAVCCTTTIQTWSPGGQCRGHLVNSDEVSHLATVTGESAWTLAGIRHQ